MNVRRFDFLAIALVFNSLLLLNFFGEVDLKPLGTPKGPFAVGCKRFWARSGQNVLCYYPIHYSNWEGLRDLNKPDLLTFGERALSGIAEAEGYMANFPVPKMTQLLNVKIEAAADAPFDLNDGTSESRLAAIVFTHGLCARAEIYSGHCRELASFGYLVFAPDCIDGSSSYTELADGTPKPFDASAGIPLFTDMQFRAKQLENRDKNTRALIDELTNSPDFLQERLGFPKRVKIDGAKIILAGHSFGGATAILSTMNDVRVRACLVSDPWFDPLVEQQPAEKGFAVNKPI